MEMKGLAFLLCILATSECFSGYMNLINEEWETYKTKYDKNYASPVEEGFRMKRYLENKLKIAEHNQRYYDGEESFYLGINSLSDRLPHEIAARNGFKQEDADKHNNAAFTFIGPDDDIELPASYDWRTKGAVTDIKNQGQCGSCWAFSSTGSLEGQHFRKTGKLVSLSEQNLMDCDKLSYSCEGGLMSTAFDYVKNNSGIDTEASYPYLADDEMCKFKRSDVGATDKGYVNITKGDENDLKKAVATIGPISVAIDASHDSFQAYGGGVYYEPDCNATLLDHGVLAVGYGTNEKGEDYWIVKNSWGKDWGLEGYILMARNRDNACGIASMALYPLV